MRASLRFPDYAHARPTVMAYDLETIAPPMPDGSFPPWPTHVPIAAGFAEARHQGGRWIFDIAAFVVGGDTLEAELIREAERRIGAVDVVASYNGRGFDALVLRLAAQRARIWDAKAIADHAAANRFGAEHADLADLYSSFGRKVGLAALCDEIGIPVKTDVAGGDVAALWEAGETERIRQYVCEDAVATLCLYFAWIASRAADEALVTQPMGALVRHIEATPELSHLQQFVHCDLSNWCRPRALKADVTAALARITARLRREEVEREFGMS